MFKRTKLQLTALNAIIFFIVIALLSSVIYFYCQATLYKNVRKSIEDASGRARIPFIGEKDDGIKQKKHMDFANMLGKDPRVIAIPWTSQNEALLENNPFTQFFTSNIDKFIPTNIDTFERIKVGEFSFETFTVSMNTAIIYNGQVLNIDRVEFLRITNSEEELLGNLLLILIIGNLVGILVVIGVGFYLSGRALIPINRAWEKQQQFVSDASHELRTPLTVIQTRSDLLLREPESTIEEKILDVSAISKETRRLSKLVANLLTLARSDSNQIELNKVDFRLDQLLNEIVEQFVDIAEFQGKELSLEVEEGLVFFGDKERIHQLMIILIDNALKFTKAEGNIKINCYEINNQIQISVSDTGSGISPECLPKVFDRFYQGDKSRTNSDGTGLGLSIAKWIVEKHTGKISVESVFNEGTIFTITLPKSKKN